MSIKIVCFLALAVSAYALPEDGFTEDVMPAVPPPVTELMEVSEAEAIHAEAEDYMRNAGKNACKSLADATEVEVKKNVEAQQAILNQIDKGAKCPEEGSQAVSAMENKLKNAKAAKVKADGEYDDALNADVPFGTHKFNALTKGNCNVFYNSAAYTQAEQKVKTTKDKKTKAAGLVAQATKDLQAAKDAQKTAIRACRCNTFKAHKSALEAANKKVGDANNKAWTKAAHLKCVLAGKTTNNCNVPALPQVKGTSLATGVDVSTCVSWENRPQCQNAHSSGITNNKIQKIYSSNGNGGWNSGCYLKAEATQKGVAYMLSVRWDPYKASGSGNIYAMWGFNHLSKKAKPYAHYYGNFDYAFYCHAINQKPVIYENGNSKSPGSCHCGSWSNSEIRIEANGKVNYYMTSNQHGKRHCYTSLTKATNFPYAVDESIYGQRAMLSDVTLQWNNKGTWENSMN